MTLSVSFLDVLIYGSSLICFIFILLYVIARAFIEPYSQIYRSEKEKSFYDPTSQSRIKFPSIENPYSVNLSVIIPAYNEVQRMPFMLNEALRHLENYKKQNNNFKYEIIVVSDGSTDNTVPTALEYAKQYGSDKFRVLELETNRGKGGAVTLGILSCRGAIILFADADGATKFEDILKLESALELISKCDYKINPEKVADLCFIVCGSRAHLEEEAIANRSVFRNILMHGFHFLVWLFAVRTVKDTQCGFKLFTRKAALLCFQSLHVQRWAFDVELLYIAEKFKIPLSEVAVRWKEIEGSKLIPFWSWLQMGKDLFFIWFKYKIGAWKVRKFDKTIS